MIQSILINHESGIPLFARSLMCNIGFKCIDLAKDSTFESDTLLHSALISAMLIVDKSEPEKFHELSIEKTKVLTFPMEKITAIITTEPHDDFEPLKNRLKLLGELFLEKYDHLLEEFVGDISIFTDFQEIIEEKGLLDEGERFRADCLNCKYEKACSFRILSGPKERTVRERFESIKTINFLKKMYLILTGMFKPMYLTFPVKE